MILAQNKKAGFDYHILEAFQAGMSLDGKMVKLIRERRVNITGRFTVLQKNQLQIIGLGTDSYTQNITLLLTQKEKDKIISGISIKGQSCIILDIHRSGRWLKTKIAIAKGKKNYDKKEVIKQRDIDRELSRELKN